jgi:uncharacterized protein (TIGR03437 family)
VAGTTSSTDFPIAGAALQSTFAGGLDGFLARFNQQGALAYSSYLGGNLSSQISGVTLDSQGNLFIAGSTHGLSQPASPNAIQSAPSSPCIYLGLTVLGGIVEPGSAFVAKLNPAGSAMLALTYIGGGCPTVTLAIDSQGTPWVAGTIGYSFYYPTRDPLALWQNGFISKLSPDLTLLPFSTYFSNANGIALDSSGFAYITGASAVAKVDPTPTAVSLDTISYWGADTPLGAGGYAIAPGEVVRLLGENLGPSTPVPGIVSGGSVLSQAAGIQVTFGGHPAPILLAGAGEIDTVVPFELAGQASTTVQVAYNGSKSNTVQVPVVSDALEIAGVFNGDFTVNSSSNPAQAGSVMSIYVSGLGSILPGAVDGKVNQAPYPDLRGAFQLYGSIPRVQDVPLVVTAALPAPGAVAGVIQVNFVAPPGLISVSIQAGTGQSYFPIAVH